jgi:glucokinase
MILAGDIGGTNTRLALFEGTAAAPVVIEVFPSRSFSGPEEAVEQFRAKHGSSIDAATFGIAGPVLQGRCQAPNLPWIFDSASVAQALGLASVGLVNDLEANAHGIGVLGPEDFFVLQTGSDQASGNRALISAGTGLGEAGLLAVGKDHRPYACEGGHCDFAPRNEIEIELLRYLLQRFDRVSYERVLSGPGLYNIYQFLRETGRGEEPAWLGDAIREGNPPAVISKQALAENSDLCVEALNLFVSLYGAAAGNLALKTMATGGVFIGGGIAPKILTKLKEPEFVKAFVAKGRISSLLEEIPIRVILNDKTALLGVGLLAQIREP